MLATPVRIDRAVEADIGRIVAGNDLARGIDRHRGLERRQFIEALPAIVEGDAGFSLEAAAGVGLRAAATPPLGLDRDREFGSGNGNGKGESAPAGSEGAVTGGCLRA